MACDFGWGSDLGSMLQRSFICTAYSGELPWEFLQAPIRTLSLSLAFPYWAETVMWTAGSGVEAGLGKD